MEITKVCPKCEVNKDVTEYGKDSSRNDGFKLCCKLCNKIQKQITTNLKQNQKIKDREIIQINDEEIWKVVPNFSKYEASNLGRIRSIKLKILITPSKLPNGYFASSLSNK